jgi:adenylate kinase
MKRMKDLILMGAPGSGKGSQSQFLKKMGYIQISTGDLLREEISKGSDLGQKIKLIIENGNLIDDQLALSLIESKFNDHQSFVFDGFPRTVAQAEMLTKEILIGRKFQVILFDISDSELIDRIENRRTCPACGSIFNLKLSAPKIEDTCDNCSHVGLSHRKDDQASVLKTRLEVYHNSTKPVIEHYEKFNLLLRLNADQPADLLFNQIKDLIKL